MEPLFYFSYSYDYAKNAIHTKKKKMTKKIIGL